jgi:uncharacterized protein YkwD
MGAKRAIGVGLALSGVALVVACTTETITTLQGDPESDVGTSFPEREEEEEGTTTAPSSSATKDAGGMKDASADAKPDTGTSSSGGSTSSSSGGTPASCSKTIAGASGTEPGGMIPVCCTPSSAQKTEAMQVFTLLNQYRAQMGRGALTYDVKLEASIQGHCEHMRLHGFFDHYAPEPAVKDPFVRAPQCGTGANAENIAVGQQNPAAVMTAWKNSPGHNTNMLNGSWKRVGICRSAGGYWGQVFAL